MKISATKVYRIDIEIEKYYTDGIFSFKIKERQRFRDYIKQVQKRYIDSLDTFNSINKHSDQNV